MVTGMLGDFLDFCLDHGLVGVAVLIAAGFVVLMVAMAAVLAVAKLLGWSDFSFKEAFAHAAQAAREPRDQD